MNQWIVDGTPDRPRQKIAARTFGLLLAAAIGLGAAPLWAGSFNGFEEIKADNPEQRLIFEALNLQMRQTLDSYNYDIPKMQDPFLPIKEVRGKPDCEMDNSCGAPQASSQLKLVAIAVPSDGSSPLASFEDGAGSSHIFRTGDQFGHNNGRVVKITNSTVTVEESGRDPRNRRRTTDITLRVPGPSAGLTRSGEGTLIQ